MFWDTWMLVIGRLCWQNSIWQLNTACEVKWKVTSATLWTRLESFFNYKSLASVQIGIRHVQVFVTNARQLRQHVHETNIKSNIYLTFYRRCKWLRKLKYWDNYILQNLYSQKRILLLWSVCFFSTLAKSISHLQNGCLNDVIVSVMGSRG